MPLPGARRVEGLDAVRAVPAEGAMAGGRVTVKAWDPVAIETGPLTREKIERAIQRARDSTEMPSGAPMPLPPREAAEPLAIDIRPATGADVPWIYSSWMKSFREHGSGVGRISRDVYRVHHRLAMERVTSKDGVLTIVACNPEDNAQIFGWLCGEVDTTKRRAVLYYGHVKSERRRQGIMRALCAALGVELGMEVHYAHHTKVSWLENGKLQSLPLGDIVPPGWIYNPYLFA